MWDHMFRGEEDRRPTCNELLRWEADALGEQDPEAEWVLTDYDIWMRNPHYKGERTEGHPEDHEDDPVVTVLMPEVYGPVYDKFWAGWQEDDIPF